MTKFKDIQVDFKEQTSVFKTFLSGANAKHLQCTCKFTIYHQGFFHSVRRNPSLNCVLGLPCRIVKVSKDLRVRVQGRYRYE